MQIGRCGAQDDNLRKQLDERTEELAEARKRLAEALEQQTATSEVLQIISSSPGELAPVFQTMLVNATRICEAKFGILFRYEGGLFHPAALTNVPPAFADFLGRQGSFAPVSGQVFGRLSHTKEVVHVVDRASEPIQSPSVRYGGARSLIAVPMLKGNELVGAFFIYRTEVRPFTEKQIELVQNFAAQAVIVIENTRLLNELRQRTDDLSEALEQQTATSEVLGVISSSPTQVQPVFEAMVGRAAQLCQAHFSAVARASLPSDSLQKPQPQLLGVFFWLLRPDLSGVLEDGPGPWTTSAGCTGRWRMPSKRRLPLARRVMAITKCRIYTNPLIGDTRR